MVRFHKIAQKLSTCIETDIEGEFSYKRNKGLELRMLLILMLLVMMLDYESLHYKLL